VSYKIDGPEGNESAKCHDRIAPFVFGHGVDLGCGCWKLKVTKTQESSCLGVDGGFSQMACQEADMIADVTKLSMFTDESFDYVYSSHTLEDMEYTEAVLREWWRLVKVGGNLILYLPLTRGVAKEMGLEHWQDFYPNKGEKGANVYHQRDFHPQEIRDAIGRLGVAELLADEVRGDRDEYSFLQVYRKLASSCHPARGISVPGGRRALVVRYGAIGDCIQSVPVFRKLKEEGYHVTVNCSEVAKEVLKYCPYIDELAIQIKDYVPNHGVTSGPLADYWKELAAKYDKFVNLTGAAEESLLIPDARLMNSMEHLRKEHPELSEENVFYNSVRGIQKMVGTANYYDSHLAKAGYSDTGMNGELFFSDKEECVGQDFRDKYSDKFIVMWVLSGSSYHKRYPYFQQVAQELIVRNQDVLLISVGDPECALIERSESNRYLPRSGRWPLRMSLIMTKYADLVIGPETGILNAAGCFDTPKITMLSHSSHENLCKYWKNDFCIAPDSQEVFCHPCHVLHYVHSANQECIQCKGSTHTVFGTPNAKIGGIWTCPYEMVQKDRSGMGVPAPLCTSRLKPDKVMARINEVHAKWRSENRTRELVHV
jgi:ADP-heptose:LPS heptosyltransferase